MKNMILLAAMALALIGYSADKPVPFSLCGCDTCCEMLGHTMLDYYDCGNRAEDGRP
jgi:hypothetical protein